SIGTVTLCKYGDLDGNGSVDVSDLILMQKSQAGWSIGYSYEEVTDLDGDGAQTLSDLMLLQKFTAGWRVKFGK
ncbi:MAG: hypothetical protein K6B74_05610, partial [Ruminococcus sp.]|nr:hypothetical protein [Ruminococcus sp.]